MLGRSWEAFEECCIVNEIMNHHLVRKSTIQLDAINFVNSCLPENNIKIEKSENKMWSYVTDDRHWISDYIISGNCKFTAKNILLMDAARSIYKNSPDIEKENLLLHLDKCILETRC